MSGKGDYKKVNNENDVVKSRPLENKFFENNNEICNGTQKAKTKSNKRSNHKHDYEPIILFNNAFSHIYSLGYRCKICSKIKEDKILFAKERNKDGFRYVRVMEIEEIKETYPDYPIINAETKEEIG